MDLFAIGLCFLRLLGTIAISLIGISLAALYDLIINKNEKEAVNVETSEGDYDL